MDAIMGVTEQAPAQLQTESDSDFEQPDQTLGHVQTEINTTTKEDEQVLDQHRMEEAAAKEQLNQAPN